jgi:hypothetical protein
MTSRISELIRQASFSLSHSSPISPASSQINAAVLEARTHWADAPNGPTEFQRNAAQRQICLQSTRYRRLRRGRVLSRSAPLILRLLARGALPLKKSKLRTIWEVDETALARHEPDDSSPWGSSLHFPAACSATSSPSDSELPDLRKKRGRTSDTTPIEPAAPPCSYLAPFALHVSSLLAAPAALINRVPLPPPIDLLLQSFEVLKRARFTL